MKIALTGATGFIGSHVAEALAADGHALALLVRDPARLPFDPAPHRIVVGGINDLRRVTETLDGADAVVHGAAKVGEWGTREEFNLVNVEGTRTLIAACKKAGVRRVIHLSSSSVYGNGVKDLTDVPEDAPLVKTGLFYAESKIDAERLVFQAHDRGDIVATAIRPDMVWGPRDRAFMPKLMDALRKGIVIYPGGGRKLVGLTHVRNVMQIIRLCLAREISHGRAYNVDDDDRRTMRDIVRAVCKRTGYREPFLSLPTPAAKALAFVSEAVWRAAGAKSPPLITKLNVCVLCYDNDVSVERAKKELGYQPVDRFEEWMDELVAITDQPDNRITE